MAKKTPSCVMIQDFLILHKTKLRVMTPNKKLIKEVEIVKVGVQTMQIPLQDVLVELITIYVLL
jgi:hypothetical protein